LFWPGRKLWQQLAIFYFFNQLQPVEVELIQMGNAKQHWNVPNLGPA